MDMGRRIFFFLKGRCVKTNRTTWIRDGSTERGAHLLQKRKKYLGVSLSRGELEVKQILVITTLLEKNMVGRRMFCQRWQRILVAMLLSMSWTLSKHFLTRGVIMLYSHCSIPDCSESISSTTSTRPPATTTTDGLPHVCPMEPRKIFPIPSSDRQNWSLHQPEQLPVASLGNSNMKDASFQEENPPSRQKIDDSVFSSCSVLLMLLSVTWLSSVAVIADMQIQVWDEEVVRWLFHIILIKVLTNATCIRADSEWLRPGLLGTWSRRCDLLEREKLSKN